MELTVDQALQQAVAAHQEGRLQDAERLYRAILQAQANHPDANHNLGVLAVGVGKPLEAIPLFKLAVETNPQIEQFWLSYVDALIKLQRFDEAKQVLGEGDMCGVSSEKVQFFRQLIRASSTGEQKIVRKGLSASEKRKRVAKQKEEKKKAREVEVSSVQPSHEQVAGLLALLNEGRLKEAEALALFLTEEFSNSPFGWKALGAILRRSGRPHEALAPTEKSLRLAPKDAETHYNLGITLAELDRPVDATLAYARAVSLKTDFAEAYVNLITVLKKSRFSSCLPELYPPLINLLTVGNFVRPEDISSNIFNLLKLDPQVLGLFARLSALTDLKQVTSAVEALDHLPLLHRLMRVCPVNDLEFERLFSNIRLGLLRGVEELHPHPVLINFLSTLSLQGFVNEYIYFEQDEETLRISDLENKIANTFSQGDHPQAIEVLCLACYRPLHSYPWCQKISSLDALHEVKTRLISEPISERETAKIIPQIGDITTETSIKVRQQYEENPYPRWVNLSLALQAKTVAEFASARNLKLDDDAIKRINSPMILVAGCGTGRQSIETASRFMNCHVTAVDLSRASLAYAKRETEARGLNNIDYWQADILNLELLDKDFDIVESVGVLHHMRDPLAGWRVLLSLLRHKGLMKIGLYSELGRRHIALAREEIAALGIGAAGADIRQFRQSVVESQNDNHKKFVLANDFFNLSMVRDLIFHVQEHRFTLPRVQSHLTELGLKFCGFENNDAVAQFRLAFGREGDLYDLKLWHELEEDNPDMFAGMYQFWCQKT